MLNYKIDFSKIQWQPLIKGVRHKYKDQNGIRIRLVEYKKDMPEHWCEKGHYGYLIQGKMEIKFRNKKETYVKGNGIFIPNGPKYKHKAKIITKKAIVFLIEVF